MSKSEKPEGYVFGRPTKYRKEFCQMLIDHMAEGFSFESFGALVDTHSRYLYEWAKKYEDFSEAKRLGNEKARVWWEKLHRKCAATGEGNATMIVWAQKNKWPKQYYERAPKNNALTHNINQQITMSGDFKQLVAKMPVEQLYSLIKAAETHVLEIEASEVKDDAK